MSVVLPPNKIGTGDSASGNPVRFSFVAPPNDWIIDAIYGFFLDYGNVGTWYQVGTATEAEAAEIFIKIYNSLGTDMTTIGCIVPFAGGILPAGWLVCDGSSLLRVSYPDLFAAIGTVWGSADSLHFNLPDLRGRTLVGQGTNPVSGTTFTLGEYSGEESHTLTTAEIPAHSHTEVTAVPTLINGGLEAPASSATPSTGATGLTGGGGSHNNMQPFAGVNYAIIASY